MIWKIYFTFLLILILGSIPVYQTTFRVWEGIDVIITIISLIGMFCFAWKKVVFTQEFWQTFFVIYILWVPIYYFALPMTAEAKQALNILPHVISSFIVLLILIPHFYALFLYSFSNLEADENSHLISQKQPSVFGLLLQTKSSLSYFSQQFGWVKLILLIVIFESLHLLTMFDKTITQHSEFHSSEALFITFFSLNIINSVVLSSVVWLLLRLLGSKINLKTIFATRVLTSIPWLYLTPFSIIYLIQGIPDENAPSNSFQVTNFMIVILLGTFLKYSCPIRQLFVLYSISDLSFAKNLLAIGMPFLLLLILEFLS